MPEPDQGHGAEPHPLTMTQRNTVTPNCFNAIMLPPPPSTCRSSGRHATAGRAPRREGPSTRRGSKETGRVLGRARAARSSRKATRRGSKAETRRVLRRAKNPQPAGAHGAQQQVSLSLPWLLHWPGTIMGGTPGMPCMICMGRIMCDIIIICW